MEKSFQAHTNTRGIRNTRPQILGLWILWQFVLIKLAQTVSSEYGSRMCIIHSSSFGGRGVQRSTEEYRVITCISEFTLSSAPQITCDGDVIRSAALSPAFLFFGILNRLYTATKLRIYYFVFLDVDLEEYFRSVMPKS